MKSRRSRLVAGITLPALCLAAVAAEVCSEYDNAVPCGGPEVQAVCPDCIGVECLNWDWSCYRDTEWRWTGMKDCRAFNVSDGVCLYFTQMCVENGENDYCSGERQYGGQQGVYACRATSLEICTGGPE